MAMERYAGDGCSLSHDALKGRQMTTSFLPKGQRWPFPSAGPLAGPAHLLNEVIDHKAATQRERPPSTIIFHLLWTACSEKGVVLESGMSSAGR